MDKYLGHHIVVNLTEDLWDRIKMHPQVRWSVVGRDLITKYLNEIESKESK